MSVPAGQKTNTVSGRFLPRRKSSSHWNLRCWHM